MCIPVCTHVCAQAARVRCTLGEISDALERPWGRHEAASGVSAGAYGQERGGEKDTEVRARVRVRACCFGWPYFGRLAWTTLEGHGGAGACAGVFCVTNIPVYVNGIYIYF